MAEPDTRVLGCLQQARHDRQAEFDDLLGFGLIVDVGTGDTGAVLVPPALLSRVQGHLDHGGPAVAADVVEVEHAAQHVHVDLGLAGLQAAQARAAEVEQLRGVVEGEVGVLAEADEQPAEPPLVQAGAVTLDHRISLSQHRDQPTISVQCAKWDPATRSDD
jgi:hypothetical protein